MAPGETLLTTSLTRLTSPKLLCAVSLTEAASNMVLTRSFSVYVPGWSGPRNTPAHVSASTPDGGVPFCSRVFVRRQEEQRRRFTGEGSGNGSAHLAGAAGSRRALRASLRDVRGEKRDQDGTR